MAFLRLLLLLQLSVILSSVVVDVSAFVPPAAAPKPPHHIPLPKLPPTPSVKPVIKPLPPLKAPVVKLPPAHPPIKAPSPPPPVKPALPPRVYLPSPSKIVGVQGVVFCKSCKYRGINTLTKAYPLPGALVKLVCNNTKNGFVQQTKTTDKNGYFLFLQKVTTGVPRKCRVFLVRSPNHKCAVPTNLHGGSSGAILIPVVKPPVNDPYKKQPNFPLYNVGPFAFEPHKKLPCTH